MASIVPSDAVAVLTAMSINRCILLFVGSGKTEVDFNAGKTEEVLHTGKMVEINNIMRVIKKRFLI